MFIEHNNISIADPNRIANAFNHYFANIGSDLVSNICADGNHEMYIAREPDPCFLTYQLRAAVKGRSCLFTPTIPLPWNTFRVDNPSDYFLDVWNSHSCDPQVGVKHIRNI